MKLTAQVKLQPTEEQAKSLQLTLQTANEACNYISDIAWQEQVFGQYSLHKLVYYPVRERFGLSAQMTVRCIAKVADSYKTGRSIKRTFKINGGIAYDSRILRYNLERSTVSIGTLNGRLHIPFACGERQRELLRSQQGESDLVLFRDSFYLLATCNIDDPDPVDVEGVLGVDLGIVNIAVTSDGDIFSGNQVNNVRHRHRRLRRKLQKKGTKSAKRLLKKLSGRERRFAKDVNHVISKRIVEKAQGTKRAIAVEKLTGISHRVTVRKAQRATLHSWSFYQLKNFIEYKAHMVGIPIIMVNPRNTSRTCPVCGCIDKRNRKTQAIFSCVNCGFSGAADHIAAINIGRRAFVNVPYVSDTDSCSVSPGTSLPALAESS